MFSKRRVKKSINNFQMKKVLCLIWSYMYDNNSGKDIFCPRKYCVFIIHHETYVVDNHWNFLASWIPVSTYNACLKQK